MMWPDTRLAAQRDTVFVNSYKGASDFFSWLILYPGLVESCADLPPGLDTTLS